VLWGRDVTWHAFSPPSSEFGRDVRHHLVPWEKFRLDSYVGVAFERISHGWVNGSASERVGMRHEFGFQFEFRQLLGFSQQPIRSSVIRIYPVSAKRSRAFQFSHQRRSDFDDGKLVQSDCLVRM